MRKFPTSSIQFGANRGISKIRILNDEGRIGYSTARQEVGQLVDREAEACYLCHAQAQPLTRLERPDQVRIHRAREGTRVLGLITLIENEPNCWNAACDAHWAGERILGVLDADLPLARAEDTLAA